MASLADLSLISSSGCSDDKGGFPVFSDGLGGLQHLTRLSWVIGFGTINGVNLGSLCLCTQIQHLNLPDHSVRGTDDVRLLASMLLLKTLIVGSLRPDDLVVMPMSRRCS
jgi:hypothetical protein